MTKSNKVIRLFSLILALIMSLAVITACDKGKEEESGSEGSGVDHVDYAAELKLDMTSDTLKKEVSVKSYIDGDTTHFYFADSQFAGGVMKARYLSVNTPESTGKIEEWGKAASNFTKETLKKATSIIVESDDSKWNADSTGDRYLVWVWYKTADSSEYRNLNLELLQKGLAIASNSANNRYGDICVKAINQAKAEKLCVYSEEKDPDFFYGTAAEITLRELRTNIESYNGAKVAFEGVVTKTDGQAVYVEEYDAETDRYYGMYIYYGFTLQGMGLRIVSTVGNRVRIVGSVQYYENGGTYQVADISYTPFPADDPNNVQKLGEGHPAAYVEVAPKTFMSDVTVPVGDEEKTFKYGELAMSTTISMKNLKVLSVYTTHSETDSNGAMTLTCQGEDGTVVAVRTIVLRDDNGNMITANAFEGKTIDVKGAVDYFSGSYQVKVFTMNDITIH